MTEREIEIKEGKSGKNNSQNSKKQREGKIV